MYVSIWSLPVVLLRYFCAGNQSQLYTLTIVKGVPRARDKDNNVKFESALTRLIAPKGRDLSRDLGFGVGYGHSGLLLPRLKEKVKDLVAQFIAKRELAPDKMVTGGLALPGLESYKALAELVARYEVYQDEKVRLRFVVMMPCSCQ